MSNNLKESARTWNKAPCKNSTTFCVVDGINVAQELEDFEGICKLFPRLHVKSSEAKKRSKILCSSCLIFSSSKGTYIQQEEEKNGCINEAADPCEDKRVYETEESSRFTNKSIKCEEASHSSPITAAMLAFFSRKQARVPKYSG